MLSVHSLSVTLLMTPVCCRRTVSVGTCKCSVCGCVIPFATGGFLVCLLVAHPRLLLVCERVLYFKIVVNNSTTPSLAAALSQLPLQGERWSTLRLSNRLDTVNHLREIFTLKK